MKSIYKTALIIGYKQAFVDWYNQTIDKHSAQKRVDATELNKSPIVMLTELFDSEEKFQLQFMKMMPELFCFIMNEWCNDEKYWHTNLSEEDFERFFEVRKTNSIFDTEDKIESFSLTFGLKESMNKFKKLES